MDSIAKPFERLTAPGESPGVVVTNPEEPRPQITVIAYGAEELIERDVDSPAEIEAIVSRFPVTWINVNGLGDARTIQLLGEMFHLHPLALEDVVNVHQRAKAELFDDYLFLVARMVAYDDELRSEQVCFFVGPNYVISFQEGQPGDSFDPVRARLRAAAGRIRQLGAEYLAYALYDMVVDHYFPVVEKYGVRLDRIDDAVADGTGDSETVAETHDIRRDLFLLRRVIRPHREAIAQWMRLEHHLLHHDTRLYLRDCLDHTAQLVETIDAYRELCADLRNFHLAALGQRTNETMKTLTTVATVFIPMSFVAGLYGMNFDHMPELRWRYGYLFALALMAVVASLFTFWMRRRA